MTRDLPVNINIYSIYIRFGRVFAKHKFRAPFIRVK